MYKVSEFYEEIAKDVLKANLSLVEASKAKVKYLVSDTAKKKSGRDVCAECMLIPEKYKWSIEEDYQIVIYEPNVELFTEEQKKILIEHELMHIKLDNDGIEPKWTINPHNIEDFREIIDRYGIDWSNYANRKND